MSRNAATPAVQPPIPNSYVVPGTRLIAGEYPGLKPQDGPRAMHAKLAAFRAAQVTAFVDLTEPGELEAYDAAVCVTPGDGLPCPTYDRFAIPDMGICSAAAMRAILDLIDRRLTEGHTVYVHCWGGAGRTGIVVACWLVRHGESSENALAQVDRLFRTMPKATSSSMHRELGSPQTEQQRAMVRRWAIPN